MGNALLQQSREAATAADEAAQRLTSIAQDLSENFIEIKCNSEATEERLNLLGTNFRQRAEEFAQSAIESNSHVQAFADTLQERSLQLT